MCFEGKKGVSKGVDCVGCVGAGVGAGVGVGVPNTGGFVVGCDYVCF